VVGIAPAGLPFLTSGDIWTPLTIDPGREIRLNHVITVVRTFAPGRYAAAGADRNEPGCHPCRRAIPRGEGLGHSAARLRRHHRPRQPAHRAAGAAGRRRLRASDCLRQHRQPAAFARRVAAEGDRRPHRTGRQPKRMLAQFLTESLLLSAAGGTGGLLAALWTVRLATVPCRRVCCRCPRLESIPSSSALPWESHSPQDCSSEWRPPGKPPAPISIASSSRAAARPSADSGSFLRNGLVAGELALATVLLVGAGLLMQSLQHLQQAPLGFRPEGILSFQLALPLAKYPDQVKRWALYRQVLQSLAAIPGVTGAAMSSGIPIGQGSYNRSPFMPTGASILPDGPSLPIDWRIASPGYFRLMGIPLLAGRDFTEQDGPGATDAIVVSRATAQKFWGNRTPSVRCSTAPRSRVRTP
jgi:hypothetical protein